MGNQPRLAKRFFLSCYNCAKNFHTSDIPYRTKICTEDQFQFSHVGGHSSLKFATFGDPSLNSSSSCNNVIMSSLRRKWVLIVFCSTACIPIDTIQGRTSLVPRWYEWVMLSKYFIFYHNLSKCLFQSGSLDYYWQNWQPAEREQVSAWWSQFSNQ